jgi:hypothetical protein
MTIRLMTYIATITVLTIAFPSLSRAQGVITINLSYKIVLNPANGSRPPGVTNADIDTAIAAMNALYDTYFRGYRFQRVDPITEVGGMGDMTGPSRWFNTDFFDDENGSDWKDDMEEAARSDARYRWNDNAINLYITNWGGGINGKGKCSFPGDHIIIINGNAASSGSLQLHEIGHYFDLCHTQGCSCNKCDPVKTGECHTEPGDDDIGDTLPDLECWTRDQIANSAFRQNYASLPALLQNLVDDVFLNIMSYHVVITRLTERQLDRWAHTANDDRRNVCSGRTLFVERGESVQGAVNAANPNRSDIVLLSPGAYNEPLVIIQPVTLRVTRGGPAAIGTAVAPMMSARQSPEEIDAALQKLPGIVADEVRGRLGFAGGGRKDTLKPEP